MSARPVSAGLMPAVPAYRHTQPAGRALLLVMVGSVALTAVLAVVPGRLLGAPPAPPAASVVGGAVGSFAACVVGLVLYAFSALTVEVDAEALRWHFRFGVFRRAVPRAEIARAEPTRTTLADGIGVHGWSRRVVYNVALGPAVRVERRDGRVVVLGTDDPGGLVAALGASPPAPNASPSSRARRG